MTAVEPALPQPGAPVTTACGGLLRLEPDTPSAVFRRRRIYFCLPSCQQAFERDPKTSCLALESSSSHS